MSPDSMTAPGVSDVGPVPSAVPLVQNDRRERLRGSLLIGLCCLLIYNANLRVIGAGDTYPARYLPFAIVQYHTLFFEPIEKVASQGRGDGAYWLLHRPDGHIVSLYPVIVPVVVAPLYVPAVAYLHVRGWGDQQLDHVARVMEKLAASLLASLAVSLLFLLLRRRTSTGTAMLLTIAYAFGTTHWMISSQALWQHGLAELLVIGTLLLLTAGCTTTRVIVAGLLLGLIGSNRPPDVIIAAALGIIALFWVGRFSRAFLLVVTSALPMLAVLLYNLAVTGKVAGGYGLIGNIRFFQHDLLTGLAGLMVSPTRGLLVFSPFLVFVVLAWRRLPDDRDERRLTLAMSAAIAIQILLYAKTDWRSGLSWGPRYLTDLLPFFIWILVPVVASLRGVARACFVFAVGVAIVIEAIGAFSYVWSVDLPIYRADIGNEGHDMRAAFEWQNSPVRTSVNNGLPPAELLTGIHGTFDGLASGGHAVTAVSAGQEVVATGWALAGHDTPFQVAINIDGGPGGAAGTFTDRPDVHGSLGEASLSGWSIKLDTTGLTPGVHHLTAMAWVSGKGDPRYLAERELTITGSIRPSRAVTPSRSSVGADLSGAFTTAVARLRDHQQAQGYWLTAHTTEPRFHEPHAEMNTFLTALLIDLLEPLPDGAGIDDTLQRARQHLTSQIEANGLVRYHGLPNGPGIGTLGCAITPDTDDTALAWRVAPAQDRARLTAALSILDRYRTREGLYRSWLAPRDQYQCLDPGKDPNPTDIVIQMHLMMLLSKVKPPAGRALCEALRPLAGDDRVWVYYSKTPLVPILRTTDLLEAGCALSVPESRMRTDVAGQQIWVSISRMIAERSSDAVLMRAVLREMASDDFALVRNSPPLLYHNDLSATVSRYYWSEDAGYALWLRLLDQYEHSVSR